MSADVIFRNGPIISIDPANPNPDAVAVHGNRITRAGALGDVLAEAGPSTRTIDLGGRALLPGLNDNHNHPISFGQGLSQIDASPGAAPTLASLQAAVRQRAAEQPMGWLIGRGYDDSRLDIHRHPTRYELDEATGDRPAILVRTCGHLLVANSAALRAGGVTASTPDPQGGQIDRDAHGEPVGLLRETAMKLVQDQIAPPTTADMKDYLRAAGKRFNEYGITSVGEAAISNSRQFSAYQELARDGELPMRTFSMMLIDDTLDDLASLGLQTGFGDAWFRLGPAKVFQDGSGGGRTAAMTVDYRNDPGNRGITIYTQEELDQRFTRANAAGFQMAAHAIGDLAISMILTAYERALQANPRPDARPRIEHCGMCTQDHLDRMKAIGALAIPQPSFIYYLGDSYIENFTEEQLAMSYPARSWFDQGITAVGSSDVPVVSCDPFVNLRSAVTRLTQDGQSMGPNQGVTIDEALQMFTINGAYASFEESIKGSITEGKLADLTVLSADPRSVEPAQLNTLQADLTMIDGRIVFERS
ncbi:MAG: amidohydrolase [Thermomicrobiales bacterium]|nr:amidohydrolase [Thermomicrobiales bacterium]MCO5220300.1 amidohydrolase [Thermomicrobiales bacterium]